MREVGQVAIRSCLWVGVGGTRKSDCVILIEEGKAWDSKIGSYVAQSG